MSKDRLQVFTEWLCREMPANTIITEPKWWAPRILKAVDRATLEEAANLLPSPPAAVEQPQEMSWEAPSSSMSWEDVEYESTLDSGTWISASFCSLYDWLTNSSNVDHELSYRHARTHEPITYERFLSLVNAAKAKAQPTPAQGCPPPTATQVTQATAVFAGMQRQRLWVEFAVGYMKAKCYRANSTFDDYAGDCATMADAMLAEFDQRFKGGE